MINVRCPGDSRTHPLSVKLSHLHDELAVIHPSAHGIPHSHRLRRLHSHSVELHMPGAYRLSCCAARFIKPDCPDPGVDTNRTALCGRAHHSSL